MPGLIEGIDRRTQMVGENRLELLLFHLGEKQRYAINVFKVQEVIQCPELTSLPKSAPMVRGIVNMRGKTISVIDLRMALGKSPMDNPKDGYVIITEFNRKVQGLLVHGVDRIVNMNWNDILPPPDGMGNQTLLTAVTRIDEKIIEIIDVEKILSRIVGDSVGVSSSVLSQHNKGAIYHIVVVDDSSVARNQLKRTLEQLGVVVSMANNGEEGLALLKSLADEKGGEISRAVSMLISDIEMPCMDGYTMVSEIRKDPRLKNLYVVMHTSLSGVFNTHLVNKVGADKFLPKFHPDELANTIIGLCKEGRIQPIKDA